MSQFLGIRLRGGLIGPQGYVPWEIKRLEGISWATFRDVVRGRWISHCLSTNVLSKCHGMRGYILNFAVSPCRDRHQDCFHCSHRPTPYLSRTPCPIPKSFSPCLPPCRPTGNAIRERCTIITRLAPTFLRFGSFEVFKTIDSQTGGCVLHLFM